MLRIEDLSEGWLIENDSHLKKEFVFKSYLKTISFVNAIAWAANNVNHHPDLEVSFGKCVVRITTHDSNNSLTEKDMLLAKEIDRLMI